MWDVLWTWMTPGLEALLRLVPALTLAGGFVAALMAIATFWQRGRVDRGADWWNRIEAALGHAGSTDEAMSAWSQSMLEYLCEPKFAANRPGTWRRRWRITDRDRVIVADLLTAVLKRASWGLAPVPAPARAPFGYPVPSLEPVGPITEVAIPGLPLMAPKSVAPGGALQDRSNPGSEGLESAGASQEPGADADQDAFGDRDDQNVPTQAPRPVARASEPPAALASPPGLAVAEPGVWDPRFADRRAKAELILRLNNEAKRVSPKLVTDLARGSRDTRGRSAGSKGMTDSTV